MPSVRCPGRRQARGQQGPHLIQVSMESTEPPPLQDNSVKGRSLPCAYNLFTKRQRGVVTISSPNHIDSLWTDVMEETGAHQGVAPDDNHTSRRKRRLVNAPLRAPSTSIHTNSSASAMPQPVLTDSKAAQVRGFTLTGGGAGATTSLPPRGDNSGTYVGKRLTVFNSTDDCTPATSRRRLATVDHSVPFSTAATSSPQPLPRAARLTTKQRMLRFSGTTRDTGVKRRKVNDHNNKYNSTAPPNDHQPQHRYDYDSNNGSQPSISNPPNSNNSRASYPQSTSGPSPDNSDGSPGSSSSSTSTTASVASRRRP